MTPHRTRRHASRGFSLIELMIAMVLGLGLIGGSIAIFVANVRSAELGQAVASLQSGARFALETMAADVRSAGYRGCASPTRSALSISIDGAPDGLFDDDVLGGALVGGSGWTPGAPDGYTPIASSGSSVTPGTPVAGTHALVVQYAGAPGVALSASMGSASGELRLDGSDPTLRAGGYALVSDCESADVFEVRTLGGSATARTVSPTRTLAKRYLRQSDFPASTRVFPLIGAIYYVGATGRENAVGDDVHALYLQSLPFDAAGNPPIELLEGVDQLVLSFGVTDESSGKVTFRSPDDSAVAFADVGVVRMGLLMSSIEPLLGADNDRVFDLAGLALGPRSTGTAADTPAYTADRRLRVPYDTTVNIRNRNL